MEGKRGTLDLLDVLRDCVVIFLSFLNFPCSFTFFSGKNEYVTLHLIDLLQYIKRRSYNFFSAVHLAP